MITDGLLLSRATHAAHNAYVPYSGFRVGCCLVTSSGVIIKGCNVESASYGLTNCSERVAIQNAVVAGVLPRDQIISMGIVCLDGDPDDPQSCMPCGACRQVISEFAAPRMTITIDGLGRFYLEDLLPSPFTLKNQEPSHG